MLKKLKLNNYLNNFYINHHKLPNPPVRFGKKLFLIANSATDISDGLLADLNNIIAASKCGAKVYIENIPLIKETNISGIANSLMRFKKMLPKGLIQLFVNLI